MFALYIKKFRSLERKITANQILSFQGERILHFLLIDEVFEYCFQGEH